MTRSIIGITDPGNDDGLRRYQLPPSAREIEPAIELLCRLVDDSATPVTLVPIGPLPNIALFMATYPDTARKVGHLVLMGGGTGDHLGNATPVADQTSTSTRSSRPVARSANFKGWM
jgi:pyrimidine-specific ribonucleoside hydrolase|tara:strand:- start:3281 stop:3631 length:351 start_codon:yes stop_codon:yes gene_type:complete